MDDLHGTVGVWLIKIRLLNESISVLIDILLFCPAMVRLPLALQNQCYMNHLVLVFSFPVWLLLTFFMYYSLSALSLSLSFVYSSLSITHYQTDDHTLASEHLDIGRVLVIDMSA